MESSLKLLRTVRMAMLASILFYGVLAERMTRISKSASSPFFYSVLVVSVFMVGTAFVLRRFIFSRSENVLAAKPDDKGALLPWLIGYMTTFALCEAVALLGFVLPELLVLSSLGQFLFTLPVSCFSCISRRAVPPMR